MSATKILIADDHRIFAQSLATLLSGMAVRKAIQAGVAGYILKSADKDVRSLPPSMTIM